MQVRKFRSVVRSLFNFLVLLVRQVRREVFVVEGRWKDMFMGYIYITLAEIMRKFHCVFLFIFGMLSHEHSIFPL